MTRERAIVLALLVSLSGCQNSEPCTGCGEQANSEADHADDPTDERPPDLPCGGADLMTDNLNCGTCGNKCPLWYLDTDWEAGTCRAGVCGPTWSACWPGSDNDTCDDLCADLGGACVADGCSGLTLLLVDVPHFGNCVVESQLYEARSGACDQAIPWEVGIETSRHVMCCCDY